MANLGNTIAWLTHPDRAAERKQRSPDTRIVVHVEVEGYQGKKPSLFLEFDARDPKHAQVLAEQWINLHGALSAAIRPVSLDGALGDPLLIL